MGLRSGEAEKRRGFELFGECKSRMCASSLGEYRTQRGRVYLSGIRFGGLTVPVLLGEGGGRERGVSVTDGEMAIKLIIEYQFLSHVGRSAQPMYSSRA